MPPNSHGEANPADKDPVPPPFDNTYNSPEHDAFVIKVKYQRTDDFFTKNIVDGADRARLEHAWNDLFGSWPYHDAYLGMLLDHYKLTTGSRKIADMTPARIAALPAEIRPHVQDAARALRRRHAGDEARPSRATSTTRRVRQPRLAASADGGRTGRTCARSTARAQRRGKLDPRSRRPRR